MDFFQHENALQTRSMKPNPPKVQSVFIQFVLAAIEDFAPAAIIADGAFISQIDISMVGQSKGRQRAMKIFRERGNR